MNLYFLSSRGEKRLVKENVEASAAAKEMGEYGITVNSVAPGVVMRPEETGGENRALNTNFLKQKCLASDIANLVTFMVSDEAKFITGQTYVIDGGRSLAMKGTD